jgi:hypothetical protein
MNYKYHGTYIREPSGLADHDRCWVFIDQNDCSLIVKIPSSYSEDDLKAMVESMTDPRYRLVSISNPEGTSTVRFALQNHGLATDQVVNVFETLNYNGVHTVVKVDDNSFDLYDVVWTEENGIDVSGSIR